MARPLGTTRRSCTPATRLRTRRYASNRDLIVRFHPPKGGQCDTTEVGLDVWQQFRSCRIKQQPRTGVVVTIPRANHLWRESLQILS